MNSKSIESVFTDLTNQAITLLIYLALFLIFLIIFYIFLKLYIERLQKNGKLQIYKRKFCNSKFKKAIEWFFDSGEKNNKKFIKIYQLPNSKDIVVECNEDELFFHGRRGLILLFFNEHKNEDKSYHDFNAWLNKRLYKKIISSAVFRQEIIEINKRFKKESKNINSIIHLNKDLSNNKTKSNFYKYQIIFKN